MLYPNACVEDHSNSSRGAALHVSATHGVYCFAPRAALRGTPYRPVAHVRPAREPTRHTPSRHRGWHSIGGTRQRRRRLRRRWRRHRAALSAAAAASGFGRRSRRRWRRQAGYPANRCRCRVSLPSSHRLAVSSGFRGVSQGPGDTAANRTGMACVHARKGLEHGRMNTNEVARLPRAGTSELARCCKIDTRNQRGAIG